MTTLSARKYLLLLAVLVSPAFAQEIPGYPGSVEAYDPREVAMLPIYCKHTQLFRQRVPGGDNQKEIERWSASLGPTFQALHHYCWGLMKTNRALYLARTQDVRLWYLNSTISEFDYVIDRSPRDFPLLPEILTKKGENLIRMGQAPAGVAQLERAIDLKPDYWPPYVALSDYYKDRGDIAKARGIVENALASAPDAKPLQRRLAELQRLTPEPASKHAKGAR